MTTFLEAEIKQLLDEYTQEKITYSRMVKIMNERAAAKAKEYAKECCEDLRWRCYRNAEADLDIFECFDGINKASIMETEIILP